LRDEPDNLAKLARAVALSVYLRPGFESVAYFQQLVKRVPITRIKAALVAGTALESESFFILEDFEVLPISYQMQVPIFFYLNHYDEGSTFLTRRRIHA
jgi:hypothetical protein